MDDYLVRNNSGFGGVGSPLAYRTDQGPLQAVTGLSDLGPAASSQTACHLSVWAAVDQDGADEGGARSAPPTLAGAEAISSREVFGAAGRDAALIVLLLTWDPRTLAILLLPQVP